LSAAKRDGRCMIPVRDPKSPASCRCSKN